MCPLGILHIDFHFLPLSLIASCGVNLSRMTEGKVTHENLYFFFPRSSILQEAFSGCSRQN